jgi:hypothetical protein
MGRDLDKKSAYNKRYYREHTEKHRQVMKGHFTRKKAIIQSFKDTPCMDCGNKFPPECMDFDHRGDDTKINDVSSMTTCSISKILEEIAKCDIVCSNCHRIRTEQRRKDCL